MARPVAPTDLLVTNGWYLEIPGLESPHFETVDGLGIAANDVTIVDAGTNIEYTFPTQILRFNEVTFTRTLQGNAQDEILETIVNQHLRSPEPELRKIAACQLVKLHHGVEAFRLAIVGLRFKGFTYPTLDVNAEEKMIVSYPARLDYFYKL